MTQTSTSNQQKQHSAWWELLIGLCGGIWRCWFGGSFKHVTRGIKYIVLILLVLGMYYLKGILDWQNWHMYAVIVAFMYHWAMSHGDYFKVNSEEKDEARVKWIDWTLQKIYGKDGYYNWKGNVTGLFLRYTYTAIIVSCVIPNYLFIAAGAVTALIYGLCGKLFPNKCYTKYAEFGAGAFNYCWLYFCL